MTEPTEAEAKAFQSAVESIDIEAGALLERLEPREVVAALFMAALDIAAEHGASPHATVKIFGHVLSNRLSKTLVLSIRQVSPLNDEFDPSAPPAGSEE